MTRTCHLHLGMNKTGSSSIQRTFADYADPKLRYAKLGQPNHSKAMVLALGDRLPVGLAEGIDAGGEKAARAAAIRLLGNELSKDDRDIIISGEGLSNLGRFGAVPRLVAFLRAAGLEPRCLAYVRAPGGFVSSVFQQIVRESAAPAVENLWPKYQKRFGPWIRELGVDGVSLVPFERDNFAAGDLLSDFANRLGLDPDYVAPNAVRWNDSLTAEATALIFVLRQRVGRRGADRKKANGKLVTLLRRFGQNKFGFSRDCLAGILQDNRADLDWIEDKMGSAFAVPDKVDGLAFDGTDDLADYAHSLGDRLADFLEDVFASDFGARGDPVGALERLEAHFQDKIQASAGQQG